MVAQKLLSRLRDQIGSRLPVRAAVPAERLPDAEKPATPAGQTIRIPPIARAAGDADPVDVALGSRSAYDRAVDRLLDQLMAETDAGAGCDRPADGTR